MRKDFVLLEKKYVNEVGAQGLLYEHAITKARVFVLQNDDDNRVFGIGFRTPPQDSTGICHILEHSVLNGSEKYPVKEPFMEMIKSSLQTFLNAMTYPDKTIYPVASRNEKDFQNLMDVYLDAVFHPLISKREHIFRQEGWHYELFNKDDPITYNGVVYNEMKGALSPAEAQVEDAVYENLFPDSIYRHESGGDPYRIPDLTYEAFLDYYHTYYHPSNSYIFLYGDLDAEAYLDRLQEVLGEYDYLDVDSTIGLQPRFEAPIEKNVTYSVAPGEPTESKSFLAYATLVGQKTNLKEALTASILSDVLIDLQSAEIKNRLLKEGIAEDIYASNYTGIEIPFVITAKNARPENKGRFVQIIEDGFRDLVQKGIDKDELKASLNRHEFSLRENSGFPTKGIIHFIQAMETWLYTDDPYSGLAYQGPLKELRQALGTDYFERFLEDRILKNPHKLIITANPEPGKNEARDRDVADKLAAYKTSLSDEEIQALIEANERLRDIQNSEDSEEDKAKIPKLSLKDIPAETLRIPRQVIERGPHTYLYHDIFTSGISYLSLAFDAKAISLEDAPWLSLLCEYLGSASTENYSYERLSTEEYLHTGGISINPRVYNYRNASGFDFRVVLQTKMTKEAIPDGIRIIFEQLNKTRFDQVDRFKEIIRQMKSQNEMSLIYSGHAVMISRVSSYLQASSRYNEAINGLDFYWFLSDLEKNLDTDAESMLKKLETLSRRLFNRHNLIINITGDEESFKIIQTNLEAAFEAVPNIPCQPAQQDLELQVLREGISSSSDVQFVVQGGNFPQGLTYDGRMPVIGQLVSNAYLYSKVRAQGGAYGVGLKFDQSGSLFCYSYRDPNLDKTLNVYQGVADFLETLDIPQSEIDDAIISCLNSFNPPLTAAMQGDADLARYLRKTDADDLEKMMAETLATTDQDFAEIAHIIRQAMDQKAYAVLGNAKAIESQAHLFDAIKSLNPS